MNTSNNYQFNLPQETDTVDISKLSDNWGKLDAQLKSVQNTAEITESFVGQRSNLQTDSTDTLVSAINEVNSHADTNENNLNTEIERAKKAESTLSSSIETETKRAKKAEETNSTAISTEKSRAEGAESTLTNNLNAEIERAKAAEKANADDISALKTQSSTHGTNVTNLTKKVAANESAISTLNGSGEGSVSKQVSDAVAKIVADAPDDFDTLKEISDWISTHAEDASAMNTQIETNKSDISKLSDKLDKISTSTYDDTAIKESITEINNKISNVDNTSDADKPVSTATQTALDKKQDVIDDLDTIRSNASEAKSTSETNSTAISTEKSRAEGAESTLTNNLNAEIERAKAAEKANADAIANIDTSGGGGVGSEAKCAYVTPRWLRFDPSNRKGLIIKAGTHIKNSNGDYVDFAEDTHVDMSSYITQNGADYYVYMSDDGTISAYTEYQSTGVKIGRFHTLCVDVGTIDMIAPYSPNSATVGMEYLIKSYRKENDPDFYAFYNKAVTAVTAQTYYDVCTMTHPLSGYEAKDILPESIFCLSWDTETLYEDAMVYDRDTNTVADIYLQSGTGLNTKSVYNATHTVSRQSYNHMEDMRQVGKKLLGDAQFSSFAIGSNEATNISGSTDKTTVGGHVDTNNRRMISVVGCEEMCGYLWQWVDELIYRTDSSWSATDGHGSFGQEYFAPVVLEAGGAWNYGSSCGSRSRNSYHSRSVAATNYGGRGSSQVRTQCV